MNDSQKLRGMTWTPYEIKVVLHHHSSAAEFEKHQRSYLPSYRRRLIKAGVLIHENGCLKTTDLGAALVKMWCETPLPVLAYVDPRYLENTA